MTYAETIAMMQVFSGDCKGKTKINVGIGGLKMTANLFVILVLVDLQQPQYRIISNVYELELKVYKIWTKNNGKAEESSPWNRSRQLIEIIIYIMNLSSKLASSFPICTLQWFSHLHPASVNFTIQLRIKTVRFGCR